MVEMSTQLEKTAMKARTFGGTKMSDDAAMQKDRTMPQAPKFQHRHFAAIAAMIADYQGEDVVRNIMAGYFADRLEETNPKFSRERFFRACKPR
jgi:hypothetical protein